MNLKESLESKEFAKTKAEIQELLAMRDKIREEYEIAIGLMEKVPVVGKIVSEAVVGTFASIRVGFDQHEKAMVNLAQQQEKQKQAAQDSQQPLNSMSESIGKITKSVDELSSKEIELKPNMGTDQIRGHWFSLVVC